MNGSKKKFFINLLVAAAFIISFLYFGIERLAKDVEATSAKVVENKEEVYMLSNKNSQLGSLKKKYEEIEEKMNKAFESIVNKGDSVAFIKWSEDAAKNNKVKLNLRIASGKDTKDTKDSKKSKSDAFISSIDFSFTAAGKFDDLMRFLYSMENSKYDVDISNIRINKGDFDEYNRDMIILTFDLKLYQKSS